MNKYTVWDLLNDAAESERSVSKVMDYTPERRLERTFREMRDEVLPIAARMRQDFGRLRHIAIIGSTSYEWLLAFFAIAASDHVSVLLDKRYKPEQLEELLKDSDTEIIIYDRSAEAAVSEVREKTGEKYQYLALEANTAGDPLLTEFTADPAGFTPDPGEDSLASLLMTSATTGKMKMVMLSHRNIASLVEYGSSDDGGFGMKDTYLLSLPLTHAFGTLTMLNCFFSGMQLALNHNPAKMLDDCKLYQPTFLMTIPMVLEFLMKKMEMLRAKGMPPEKVKELVFGAPVRGISCGGAPINQEVGLKYYDYGFVTRLGYGLTELASLVSVNYDYRERPGSVGRILGFLDAKIEDGELLLKGPSVMMGYYKNEEETKAVLRDGWLYTGDLAEIDEDGYLFLTGRKKNLIILSNGENISPENIEDLILSDDAIEEAMVYGADDKLCAAVRMHNEADGLEQANAVIRAVNAKLPEYSKITRVTVRTEEFPKNALGKIIRREVKLS